MSGELPPLYNVSGDDHGAYCIVSTVTWACITGFTAIIRFALAWHHRLKVGSDDISFAIAAAFAIASLALYPVAVNDGLGEHIEELDAQSVSQYFKTIYAAEIVGIVAIGCSKISAALLSKRAVLIKPRYFYSFVAAVAVWLAFSLFAAAFQCQLPRPWIFLPSNCPLRGNLQYAVTIFSMITDVILSVWVIRPVWRVNMPRQERIIVIILFGTRIIIPGVAIGQLIYLAIVMESPDQTFDSIPLVLFNQAILNLSVVLATVPRVNRFLYSVRDNLVFPRISDFELGRYHPDTGSSGEPKITPSHPNTTDPTTPPYNTHRAARLKPWKRHVVMGGQEEKNTSTSTLHDRDVVAGCETSVETDDPSTDCQTMTNRS